MSERIILGLNIKQIVSSTRSILVDKREIPINCPNPKCVGLHSIRDMGINGVKVILDANPPELPAKRKSHLYDIHPVCKDCIFQGNSNYLAELTEENGKLENIRVNWRHVVDR